MSVFQATKAIASADWWTALDLLEAATLQSLQLNHISNLALTFLLLGTRLSNTFRKKNNNSKSSSYTFFQWISIPSLLNFQPCTQVGTHAWTLPGVELAGRYLSCCWATSHDMLWFQYLGVQKTIGKRSDSVRFQEPKSEFFPFLNPKVSRLLARTSFTKSAVGK